MYQITYTNRFKKDVKRAVKRGYDISLLEKAIDLLQQTGVVYHPNINLIYCRAIMQANMNVI